MHNESKQEDFNNLKQWLLPKLEARRMSVEDLAVESGVSRRSIYGWMDDTARPTTQKMAKIVHTLSAKKILKLRAGNVTGSTLEEVTLEDALQQYTERKSGRPVGSGTGVRAVTSRSR